MATRQELYTAIGLIRQTCRVNIFGDNLVLNLQALGDYSEQDPSELDGLTPFLRQKRECEVACNVIKSHSEKIEEFIGKVDSTYLDNGIDAIPVPATRLKIIADIQTSKTLSTNAKPYIDVANKEKDLADLSTPFESYIPECGIDEPDPWALFSSEVNYSNILHDILDAMSYELQGINSYTGNLHNYDTKQFNRLISNRILTANVQLNVLPSNLDVEQMRGVVEYVEENFGKVSNATLAQHIDSEIPKAIMLRRVWAL